MSTAGRLARTAGLAVTAGFAVGITKAISAAGDFEQSLNVFQSVTKASGKQMAEVSGLAKDLGNDLSLPATSAKDAADAMTELAKGGLDVTQTMAAAKGVLQLSAAAQIDNAEAATITARALKAFHLEGSEASRVADVFANAANASTGEITDFALGLQQSSAVASQWGLTINDTTAALMEMADAGVVGADAGTSLKTFLQSLTPTSKKATAAMRELNVHVFDQQGKFVGLRSVVGQFQQGLKGLSQEQQTVALKTIFGSDAIRAANILFRGGVTALDSYVASTKRQGAASDLAAAKMKGFKGALEGFKSTLETLEITVGTPLLKIATGVVRGLSAAVQALTPFLTQVMNGVASALSQAAGYIQAHWEQIRSAGVEVFDQLKTVVTGFANFIRSDFGQKIAAGAIAVFTFVKAVTAIKAAVTIANAALTALRTNPIFLVLGAVSFAVGVFAQDWLRSKFAVDQFAASATAASTALNALKGSMDRITQSHLDLHQAQLNVATAQIALVQATRTWHQIIAEGKTKTAEGQQAYLGLRQALLGVKQAQEQVKTATKGAHDAESAHRAEVTHLATVFTQARDKAWLLSGALQNNEVSSSKARQEFAKLHDGVVAQIPQLEKQAKALEKQDPAAARAAAGAANYGRKLEAILRVATTAPQKFGPLLDKLMEIAPKGTLAGEKAHQGFLKGVGKMVGDAGRSTSGAVRAAASAVGPAHAVGVSIGASLAAGMHSQIGAVAAEAAALGRAAEVHVRAATQVHSYSPLFGQIGQWISKSISIGMVAMAPLISAAAKVLGRGVTDNIVAGLKEKQQTPRQQMAATLQAAVASRADIEAAAKALGRKQAQNIAAGILGYQPTLRAQIHQQLTQAVRDAIVAAAQAVESAKGTLASAYSSLASAALSAFDAVHAGWVPPAQTILDKLALDKQIADVTAAVGPGVMDLYNQIGAALAAGNSTLADKLTTDLAGQVAGQIASAQSDLAAAQAAAAAAPDDKEAQDRLTAAQARLDALLQAQQTILGLIAGAEQKAHDAAMKQQKDNLEKQLDALETQLKNAKTPEAVAKIMTKIKTLLAKNGLTLSAVLGVEDFDAAKALFDQIPAVEKAAKALVEAIKKQLKIKATLTITFDNANPGASAKGPGLASGGFLPGPTTQGIPIMAHGNEFVLNARATRKLGLPALFHMNRTGKLPGFDEGGMVGDSDYADALRKAHGKWTSPRHWAPGEYDYGSKLIGYLQQTYGDPLHFEDAPYQALWALRNRALPDPLGRPPHSISDATWGQIWYDFPGGSWPIPALAGGGRILADGLYYGHRGETITPARAGTAEHTTVVYVMLDRDVLVRHVTRGMQRNGNRGRPGITRPDLG